MIYLDASALVKLLFEERESAALHDWLVDRVDTPRVSSELSVVEVLRVCRRHGGSVVAEARVMLGGLDLIPLASVILERAAMVGSPELHTLDALHLASVLSIRDGLVALVTYDQRLAAAGVNEQLDVVAPA